MASFFDLIARFSNDQRGSITLLLLFAFTLVFGTIALAVETARYFAMHSRLEGAIESAALIAGRNRDFLGNNALQDLAKEFVKIETTGSFFPVLQSEFVSLQMFSITRSENGVESRITASASLPTTLMRSFFFAEDVLIERSMTVRSQIENREIVLVADLLESAGSSGTPTASASVLPDFTELLDKLRSKSDPFGFTVVPLNNDFATAFADVSDDFQKTVLLIAASHNLKTVEEKRVFQENCTRLKEVGAHIYVINYEAPTAAQTLLQNCASSSVLYFSAVSVETLHRALKDILKFLLDVRIVAVD